MPQNQKNRNVLQRNGTISSGAIRANQSQSQTNDKQYVQNEQQFPADETDPLDANPEMARLALTVLDPNLFSSAPKEREAISKACLDTMYQYLAAKQRVFSGYQINEKISAAAKTGPFLDFNINNIGDPYQEGYFRLSLKPLERSVLHYWSQVFLQGITPPTECQFRPARLDTISPVHEENRPAEEILDFYNELWGVVLSMGCTEGNLYALRNARDYLRGKYIIHSLYDSLTGEELGGRYTERDHNVRTVYVKKPLYYDDNGKVVGFGPIRAQLDTRTMDAMGPATNPSNLNQSLSQLPCLYVSSLHDAKPTFLVDQPADATNPQSSLNPIATVPLSQTPSLSTASTTPATATFLGRCASEIPYLCTAARLPIHINPESVHNPVILYSTASHYSIGKIKDLLELHDPKTFMEAYYPDVDPLSCGLNFPNNLWPHQIPAHLDGCIDMDCLKMLADFFFSIGAPIIFSLNYGTTFTGSYDNPKRVYEEIILPNTSHIQHETEEAIQPDGTIHLTRKNYWVHVDGALGGSYGAFFMRSTKQQTFAQIKEFLAKNADDPAVRELLLQLPRLPASNRELSSDELQDAFNNHFESITKLPTLPQFTFGAVPGLNSIAMSSHKFLGTSCPGGVVFTCRKYMLDYHTVSYVGSPDTSIAGSRNGLNVLQMWDHLMCHPVPLLALKYLVLLEKARYAAFSFAQALNTHVVHYRLEPDDALGFVFHFSGSLSVIIPRPSDQLIEKYSLSCDTLSVDVWYPDDLGGHNEVLHLPCCHIFAMESLTLSTINSLARALSTDTKALATVQQYQSLNQRFQHMDSQLQKQQQQSIQQVVRPQSQQPIRQPSSQRPSASPLIFSQNSPFKLNKTQLSLSNIIHDEFKEDPMNAKATQ